MVSTIENPITSVEIEMLYSGKSMFAYRERIRAYEYAMKKVEEAKELELSKNNYDCNKVDILFEVWEILRNETNQLRSQCAASIVGKIRDEINTLQHQAIKVRSETFGSG